MARVNATHHHIAPTAQIADSAVIEAETIFISDHVSIGERSVIRAKTLRLGYKCMIESDVRIEAIGAAADDVRIGDFSRISEDTRMLVPILELGDYTVVHNHVLINGYKPVQIGHNSFIGQHSVLNAAERLTIGNNFRMALNGYVWTHAESGELLEGCTFYHRTPTVIEDDVWLAGCNISISPGVTLGRGSIVLPGSVVTKDTEPWHC
jgi:acetyltransferase-like isoleucine patch superfamily enzyme